METLLFLIHASDVNTRFSSYLCNINNGKLRLYSHASPLTSVLGGSVIVRGHSLQPVVINNKTECFTIAVSERISQKRRFLRKRSNNV